MSTSTSSRPLRCLLLLLTVVRAPIPWSLVAQDTPVFVQASGSHHFEETVARRVPAGGAVGGASLAAAPAVAPIAGGAPTIIAQPSSLTVATGQTATFTVAVSDTVALTYQWRKNGAAIAGATNATLTLPAVQSGDAGTYAAVVTSATGSSTSQDATLVVVTAYVNPVGTPGTGNPWSVSPLQHLAARITLASPARIVQATAEFTHGVGTFVASLVRLAGSSSLPAGDPAQGLPFNATEVVASATFALSTLSTIEVAVPLNYDAAPGVYGVIFSRSSSNAGDSGGMRPYGTATGSSSFYWTTPPGLAGRWGTLGSTHFKIGLGTVPLPTNDFLVPSTTIVPRVENADTGAINAWQLLADGRLLVGGNFTSIGDTPRTYLARLTAAGALDPSYVPPALDGPVDVFAVQSDGKILVGGEFARVNGQPAGQLIRLNPDGTLDAGFSVGVGFDTRFTFGPLAGGGIRTLALQPDGRILVGGNFARFQEASRPSLVRLTSAGALDSSFTPSSTVTTGGELVRGVVRTIHVQADGKIVVGGTFAKRLARLNADGSLDSAFAANLGADVSSGNIYHVRAAAGGKLWIAGTAVSANYVSSGYVARRNSDGSADTTFVSPALTGDVLVLHEQVDGRLLVAGDRLGPTRLSATGAIEGSVTTNGTVNALVPRSDGSYLVGDSASSMSGALGGSRPFFYTLTGLTASTTTPVDARAQGSVAQVIAAGNGKYYVSGWFTHLNTVVRPGLARIDGAGVVDGTFTPVNVGNTPRIVLQPDGRLLVRTAELARLNSDGSRDTTFSSSAGYYLTAHALDSQGRVLIARVNFGNFQQYVERLLANGAPDSSFTPISAGTSGFPYALATQSDGRIIVGGYTLAFDGSTPAGLARLTATGARDTTFTATPDSIFQLFVLGDDRIYGGRTGAGSGNSTLLRFASNGAPDTGFNAFFGGTAGSTIMPTTQGILPLADGRVIRMGGGDSTGGPAITRHAANGARDTTFAADVPDGVIVSSLVLLDAGGAIAGTSRGLLFLTEGGRPVITIPPAAASVVVGGTATFAVTASGGALGYQWKFNDVALAGATGATLTLPNITSASAGNYTVVVTNPAGSVTSAPAALTVIAQVPPTITSHPVGRTLNVGDVAGFSVTATGSTPLTYQWRKNGTAIAGETASTYVLGPVTTASAGSFDVIVSNAAGSATSAAALLAVNPPVTFTTQPAGATAYVGASVTFTALATGSPNYQWRKGGSPIAGTNSPTLTLAAVQLADAGSYDVVASTPYASTTSTSASLSVLDAAPSISTQPVATTVAASGAFTLSVATTGSLPMSYQWKLNGTTLVGATQSALTIANAQGIHAGDFTVVVTNALGHATSSTARVNVVQRVIAYSARLALDPDGAVGTFVIEGTAPKKLLLRAVGPGLTALGVTGAAPDPRLELFDSAGRMIDASDDWIAAPDATAIATAAAAVGAFALPAGSRDAALLRILAPGAYTVRAHLASGGAGTVYLELYDADLAAVPLSTLPYAAVRGRLAPNGGIAIGGLAHQGRTPRSFLLRALGPALSLPGALANPSFQVVRDGTLVASNDDWDASAPEAAATTAATTRLGASLLPAGARDAALVLTGNLHAGASTVEIRSADTTGGTTLIELHDLDASRPANLAPVIASQPIGATITAGAETILRVIACGTAPLVHQWYYEGDALAGETQSSLTIASTQLHHAGHYTVRVSNAYGAATSIPAAIAVPGGPAATHAIVAGSAATGSVTVTNTLTVPTGATGIGWSVAVPEGWSFLADAGAVGDVRPLLGDTSRIEWAWLNVPASSVTFTYTLKAPAGSMEGRALWARAVARVAGVGRYAPAAPTPLLLPAILRFHTADYDRDGKLNLAELLRVIELYNYRTGTVRTGQYTLLGSTEDGFTPGPNGTALSRFHSADTMGTATGTPPDGKLNLAELLRVIELYNYRAGTVRTGQYRVLAGT
ncbi:MAG: immunoglobulin domain-containing protein, partial [Verrucomicrobia bacterium]|nr:immunoglobulin domain-containing protein [Verrucomicrobiota bacterium]